MKTFAMKTTPTAEPTTLHPWAGLVAPDMPEVAARDLHALGEHLGLCKSPHAHLLALRCAAISVHGFMVSRFVTTMVVLGLFALLATWVL